MADHFYHHHTADMVVYALFHESDLYHELYHLVSNLRRIIDTLLT